MGKKDIYPTFFNGVDCKLSQASLSAFMPYLQQNIVHKLCMDIKNQNWKQASTNILIRINLK